MNKIIESIGILIHPSVPPREAVPVLRRYLGATVTDLSAAIQNAQPVRVCDICNEEFYSGIREFMQLVNALESAGVPHQLLRNGEPESLTFFENIIHKLDNLSLEDIR